jgi:hypothetical protein
MLGAKGNGDGARVVESMMAKWGCLPTIGPGSQIDRFRPLDLAECIRQELSRGTEYGLGNGKITIHLDVPDAVALMNFLKEKGS